MYRPHFFVLCHSFGQRVPLAVAGIRRFLLIFTACLSRGTFWAKCL